MEMVPCKLSEIKREHSKDKNITSKEYYELLDNFLDSEHSCVKITGWEHVRAVHCQQVISRIIKRRRIVGVKCALRDNEVFLIKTEI